MVTRTATTGGAVEYSPVVYNSPAAGLMDLFKYFAGTQTSGSSSGVVSQQGQTAPLEALIAMMSDPANLENLVASMFQKGAAQVPGLTQQFANATGTRTTNNNMLGLSLAELNQSIAQAIAQAAVQQTNNAAQAAGKLAEVNKVQSTSGQQTQKTAAAPGAAGKGLLTLGGLYGLNRFEKELGLGKSKDSTASSGGTVSTTPVFSGTPGVNSPVDVVSGVEAGFNPSIQIGSGSTIPPIEAFNIDIPSISFDAGSSVSDLGGGGGFDYTPDFGDGGAEFDFDFFGFADGGLVTGMDDPRRRRTSPAFFNSVRPGAPATLDFEGIGARNSPLPPVIVVNTGTGAENTGTGSVDSETSTGNQGTGDSTSSTTDSPGNVNAQGSLASGLTAGVLSGNPITGLVVGLGNFFMKGLMDAIFSPPTAVTEEIGPPAPPTAEEEAIGVPSTQPTAEATGTPGAPDAPSDTPDAMGGGIGSDDSSAGTGDTGGDTGGADSSGFIDGGVVKAQDKKHRRGIDLIPIKATAGEYVLPLDTVELIGVEILDELVAATHTAVKGGTR